MRITSLPYSPFEARRTLRERLRRHLDRFESSRAPLDDSQWRLTDPQVLELLLAMDVQIGLTFGDAQTVYDGERAQHPSAPPFATLFEKGWLLRVWDRVYAHRDLRARLENADDDTRACASAVLARVHDRRFSLRTTPTDPMVIEAADALVTEAPAYVPRSPNPAWVAARLWEQTPQQGTPADRLRFWMDRWNLLQNAWFIPSRHWAPPMRKEFEEAVLQVLETESSILGWSEERERVAAALAVTQGRDLAEVLPVVHHPGRTLIERHEWIEGRDIEHAWMEGVSDARRHLSSLVHLLLEDVTHAEYGPVPLPAMRRLLELAGTSPFVLFSIIVAARRTPELLADLSLHAPMAPLAVALVASATLRHSAWDSSVRDENGPAGRLASFGDAVEVLSYYIQQERIDSAELASLVTWLEKQAKSVHWQTRMPTFDARMGAHFDREIARWPPERSRAIVSSLLESGAPALGDSRFTALLHVLAVAAKAPTPAPGPIVMAYVASIRALEHPPSTVRLQAPEAAALAKLASDSGLELFQEFLYPIAFREEAIRIGTDGTEQFERTYTLQKRLRMHVRVLARAAIGWAGGAPTALIDAIVDLVQAGAETNLRKGMVAAFATQHETWRHENERSIATDLAELLRALPEHRARLLAAMLAMDEPLVLAEIARVAPPSAAKALRQRIDQLTPLTAGETWTLPEVHRRIEALLEVGADDAAERFLIAEQQLQTHGRVRGRETFRFRAQLRIWLHREQFQEIIDAVPPDLKGEEEREARDTLAHYRALAEMKRGGDDLQRATDHFRQRHESDPSNPNFALNYFAALAQGVLEEADAAESAGAPMEPEVTLATAPLGPTPERLAAARSVLKAGEMVLADVDELTADERRGYSLNRALVLLAVGESEEAIDALRGLPEEVDEDEAVLAMRVAAMTRADRVSEASATLDRAKVLYGETEWLREARRRTPRNVATQEPGDPIQRLRLALAEIATLPPDRKAMVWRQSSEPALHELLIHIVRTAAMQVMALVPTMRALKMDGDEDRVTALLKSHLAARLDSFGWTADSGRGGHTAKGNPGHRDLTICAGVASELTVLEAIVCKRGPTTQFMRGDLTEHFIRLFAYGRSPTVFHLTYSLHDSPLEVTEALEGYAASTDGTRLRHLGNERLPDSDDGPKGFVASYDLSGERRHVVFLVLDLMQASQREAAVQSAKLNPRKSKTAKQGK